MNLEELINKFLFTSTHVTDSHLQGCAVCFLAPWAQLDSPWQLRTLLGPGAHCKDTSHHTDGRVDKGDREHEVAPLWPKGTAYRLCVFSH